jgi:hypothetical protein
MVWAWRDGQSGTRREKQIEARRVCFRASGGWEVMVFFSVSVEELHNGTCGILIPRVPHAKWHPIFSKKFG